MECAPLPSMRISASVSFYCENKSRCSCPFWIALCKRRHGGIPILEWTSPIDFDSCFDSGPPQCPLSQVCMAPTGDLKHPRDFSDPKQEVCSRNGTCISCVLTTGTSASSLNTFNYNSLLQSFTPHNICSKCSSFLTYLIPGSVANDHSRALLTPYKVGFNSFKFFLFFLTTACYPFLLPSPLYRYFDFHIT